MNYKLIDSFKTFFDNNMTILFIFQNRIDKCVL